MSDNSIQIGGTKSSSPLSKSEYLKSGPTPREVEVLERRHRDRVHAERGKPGEAHQLERGGNSGSNPRQQGSILNAVT